MIGGQIHAVHRKRQKGRGIQGALDRHRPAETALVESDEVDINGARADSHQGEYRG